MLTWLYERPALRPMAPDALEGHEVDPSSRRSRRALLCGPELLRTIWYTANRNFRDPPFFIKALVELKTFKP